MRWSTKRYEDRSTCIRSWFLLFPKTIRHETRWLEWATWEEMYVVGVDYSAWMPARWIDEEGDE